MIVSPSPSWCLHALLYPIADPSACPQNAEIFTLTYGSIVRQLLSDLEDIDAVNKQLDQMYAACR